MHTSLIRISAIAGLVAVVGILSPGVARSAGDMGDNSQPQANAPQSGETTPQGNMGTMHSPSKSTLKQTVINAKNACTADAKKLCSDVTPGGGKVISCLDSKSDQLSPECAASWHKAKAEISRDIDKADVAFRKDCGSDVQKFCANVPSGRGRLLNCLDKHEDALSNSCKYLQAKIDQEFGDFWG